MLRKLRRLLQSLAIGLCLSLTTAETGADAANSDRRPAQDAFGGASVSPGLQIGLTSHDLQKYGSMGHQIATHGAGHVINFCWTNKTNGLPMGGQNVRFDAWDPSIGFLGDGTGGLDIGATLVLPDFGGFVTMDALGPNDLTVVALEWDTNFPSGLLRPWVFYNSTPSLADFVGAVLPDAVWTPHLSGNATVFRWPQVAYTNDGASTEITHLLIFSDRTDDDGEIIYTRKVGSGLAGTWSSAMLVGSGGFHRSGVIVTSRKASSQKVAIAWIGGRGNGTEFGASVSRFDGLPSGQLDNDVYYMTSTDAGASWGATHNITQRSDSLPGGFGAARQADCAIQFINGYCEYRMASRLMERLRRNRNHSQSSFLMERGEPYCPNGSRRVLGSAKL